MAIKAEELRIGNSVIRSRNVIVEITGVTKGVIFYGNVSSCILEYCDPIYLTEEWLTRFGFIPIKNGLGENIGHYDHDSENFHICPDSSGFDVYILDGYKEHQGFWPISSVHELQNLFYALTKTELLLSQKP